jgi:membrane protein
MPASSSEATGQDRRGDAGRGGSDDRGRSADKPSEIPKEGWKDIAKRVVAQIKAKHTQLLAAGVAFWAFLSLFPAMIAAITIFGLVMDPEEVTERLAGLLDALPDEAATLVQEQLEGIAGAGGTALGVGLITSLGFALWAASTGMANLMEATNVVYSEHDDRKFPKKRGLALLFTLGAILFLGLTLAGIAALPGVLAAAGVGGAAQSLLSLAVWPILGLGFVAGLAVLYRYGPDRADAEWRWVSWGAVIAVVVWVVASIAFQFYVANFGNYQETYGALAAVVILMFWLLLSSLIVLVGGHINAEMEAQTAQDTTTDPDGPMGQRDAYKADNLGPVDDDIGLRTNQPEQETQPRTTEEHAR